MMASGDGRQSATAPARTELHDLFGAWLGDKITSTFRLQLKFNHQIFNTHMRIELPMVAYPRTLTCPTAEPEKALSSFAFGVVGDLASPLGFRHLKCVHRC